MGEPGDSPSFGRPSAASAAPWRLAARVAAEAGVRCDAGDSESFALRAATVVGVRHRLAGTAVQDSWSWGMRSDGAVVVAVGDGVGTLGSSGSVAAAVTTEAVAALGADGDAATGPAAAIERANQAVFDVVDGASTLVVAVVRPDGRATLARVGDSTAFVLSAGVWSEVFATADLAGDDIRSPATAALPSPVPATETVELDLALRDVLILVTDGVGDPLRDGPQSVAPSLAAALGAPPTPIGLAAIVDFSRQGCHDDRTLAGIWRLDND